MTLLIFGAVLITIVSLIAYSMKYAPEVKSWTVAESEPGSPRKCEMCGQFPTLENHDLCYGKSDKFGVPGKIYYIEYRYLCYTCGQTSDEFFTEKEALANWQRKQSDIIINRAKASSERLKYV